jgi:hypothetical protein
MFPSKPTPITPMRRIKAKKPTESEQRVQWLLLQSKRMGHTANVAHAVGIYPA